MVRRKTKAAAEIRLEDDELSAVWKQRVLFLSWSLKLLQNDAK